MQVLALLGSPEQQDQWLQPLLAGEIRSAFAMTEPGVASSDATNIALANRRDGEEGSGLAIAQARLGPGRIHHCMRCIGTAERALELMCRRVTARVAFGRPLADQGVIREWTADSLATPTENRTDGSTAPRVVPGAASYPEHPGHYWEARLWT